ncbi:MAG TPA: hypothetical protein VK027_04085 [Chitinophagaceae bacterium]|nr:hypothetical protein [Chitinophagaceae bacterium]
MRNEEKGLRVEISEEGLFQDVKKLLDNPELMSKYARSLLLQNNSKEKLNLLLSTK